jgi:hypothetical protein
VVTQPSAAEGKGLSKPAFRIPAAAGAYVSIRQHTSAKPALRIPAAAGRAHGIRQHTSAYVSIRQHTSAYVSIRQHTSAYVSIRQHTSAFVSIPVGKKEPELPSPSYKTTPCGHLCVSVCTIVPVKQVSSVQMLAPLDSHSAPTESSSRAARRALSPTQPGPQH